MDNQFIPAILASVRRNMNVLRSAPTVLSGHVAMSAIQLLMRAKRALSQPDLACAINDRALLLIGVRPGADNTAAARKSVVHIGADRLGGCNIAAEDWRDVLRGQHKHVLVSGRRPARKL